MIFDTDILIWTQRGNKKAAKLIDNCDEHFLSIYSYMELLQCAKNKQQNKIILDFLKSYSFQILPFTENIGHRAAVYIEEYSLKNGIKAGDAIVAATAVENVLTLCTANKKHFNFIKELDLKILKP